LIITSSSPLVGPSVTGFPVTTMTSTAPSTSVPVTATNFQLVTSVPVTNFQPVYLTGADGTMMMSMMPVGPSVSVSATPSTGISHHSVASTSVSGFTRVANPLPMMPTVPRCTCNLPVPAVSSLPVTAPINSMYHPGSHAASPVTMQHSGSVTCHSGSNMATWARPMPPLTPAPMGRYAMPSAPAVTMSQPQYAPPPVQQGNYQYFSETTRSVPPPPWRGEPTVSSQVKTPRSSRSKGRPTTHSTRGGYARSSSGSSQDGEDGLDKWCEASENEGEGRQKRMSTRGPKLPPFTGSNKESWEVWYNRFTDVASRCGWGNEQKLDHLLPKLQGVAGEFVYGQLDRKVRMNYKGLIKELNHRFKKVETAKAYAAKFSSRAQKPGETATDYAAELKRLYCKAYSSRDSETRCEDLLRRFLDGLHDDNVRFHVEYVKEPSDIDQAVYEVVRYADTQRSYKNKKVVKATQNIESESGSDSGDEAEQTARLANNKPGPKSSSKQNSRSKPADSKPDLSKKPGNPVPSGNSSSVSSNLQGQPPTTSSEMAQLTEMMTQVLKRMDILERERPGPRPLGSTNADSHGYGYQQGAAKRPSRPRVPKENAQCYRCNQYGHYARECSATAPVAMETNQVQVTPANLNPNAVNYRPRRESSN
jgi:hypothetical protein